MKINIDGGGTQEGKPAAEKRFQKDLLYVADSKQMYINEKGYLQKLLELLYKTGYYEDNESLFVRS